MRRAANSGVGEVRALQQWMHRCVVDVAEHGGGGSMHDAFTSRQSVATNWIRSTARLPAAARLEIYRRSYWDRVLRALSLDCAGLRTALGAKRFARLVTAYLRACPSRSFSLRNLPARMAEFIRATPRLTAPHTKLAYAIARLEWADAVAFDGAGRPPITPSQLLHPRPQVMRVKLQPYLSLLALDWPVDTYVARVRSQLHVHAPGASGWPTRVIPPPLPRPRRIHVVVHRHQQSTYYKRISAHEFRFLEKLREGACLAEALTAVRASLGVRRARALLRQSAELGWFCRCT